MSSRDKNLMEIFKVTGFKLLVFFFSLAIHDSNLDASEVTAMNALNSAASMLEV